MSVEWPEVRLEDITLVLGDGLHGTPQYDDAGEYYFINGNNLSNGNIVLNEKTKRANEEEFLKHRKNLNDRTILVSINGTLGNVALYNGEKVFLGKSACYFNVNEGVDKQFVRYVVSSGIFQNYIHSRATGSTIKNVSLKLMRDFTFRLPPLEIQKEISKVLEILDKKIELNRQTNQTLENIAQAIFKSWFVDFDPTLAKIAAKENGQDPERAAMAAIAGKPVDQLDTLSDKQLEKLKANAVLFPDKLVESELGEIPEGWDVRGISELCSKVESGGTPSRKETNYWDGGDIPWLTSGEVRQTIVIKSNSFITKAGLQGSSAKLWQPLTTIVAMYGATAGQVTLLACETSANQACCALIPKEDAAFYVFFKAKNSVQVYEGKASGSAQQNLNKSVVSNLEVILPSEEILKRFEMIVSPNILKMISNEKENFKLEQLRNSLLPKLLSGELNIFSTKKAIA